MSKIFGILNITPDSFSDGGKNFEAKTAINSAFKMLEEGAFGVDIGAESTRPNATVLSPHEEIERLKNILPEISKNAFVSLDTRNFETAKWGIENGIKMINDVSGFKDEKILKLACETEVYACFMHSLTVPADPKITMQGDVLKQIYEWAENKILQFEALGKSKEFLIFDPGIGFGKTAEQSLLILQNIEYFKTLGVQILVGHSRKSFLSFAFKERFKEETPVSIFEKDLMTSIFSALLWEKVEYLRLHNIKLTNILQPKIF